MTTEQPTAILHSREDSLCFLRDLPPVSKIITLTPDAAATLKGKVDLPILSSMSTYSDYGHRRVLARIRRMEQGLLKALDQEKRLTQATRETVRGFMHLSCATAIRLHVTLPKTAPWLIVTENGIETIHQLEELQQKLMKKIMASETWQAPKAQNPLLVAIARLVNRWVASWCSRFSPVFFTAYQYGNNHLAANLGKQASLSMVGHTDCLRAIAIPAVTLLNFLKGKKQGRLVAIPNEEADVRAVLSNLLDNISDPIIRNALKDLRGRVLDVATFTKGLEHDFKKLMQTATPKVVVAHSLRWLEESVMGETAKSLGIESLLLSHGSHPKPDSASSHYEHGALAQGLLASPLASTNYLQSPHAKEALSVFNGEAPTAKVKPVMWGYKPAPAPVFDKKEKTILHAGTYKTWSSHRPWIYETSDEFVQGLVDLVEATRNLSNTKLIIRIRTAPECSLETLETLLPTGDHYEIKSTGNFLDDLASADLLVSFSSTTIEEALHAKKPVLLWGGSMRYHHVQAQSTLPTARDRSAVYAPKSQEALPEMIESILNVHGNGILTDKELEPHVWLDETPDGSEFLQQLM